MSKNSNKPTVSYPLTVPSDWPYPYFTNSGKSIVVSKHLRIRLVTTNPPRAILSSVRPTDGPIIRIDANEIRALVTALCHAASILSVIAARGAEVQHES